MMTNNSANNYTNNSNSSAINHKRAVVFAYHNVGVRCIKSLLNFGIEIALIVTHNDNPNENIWFDSVKQIAIDNDIAFITPDNPNEADIVAQIAEKQADFIFSFYYRNMLKQPILSAAKYGAFNMHGSLLPFYRGRVPINWAIINGETQTGATLHQMNVKPDNGPIVDQIAVPILIDDTAADVFAKVTVAAELVLNRSLPKLCANNVEFTKQDLTLGAYFGGRKPEDGRINKQANAKQLHDFIRALTKPYPGAFFDINNKRVIIWKSRIIDVSTTSATNTHQLVYKTNSDINKTKKSRWLLHGATGGCIELLEIEVDGQLVDNKEFLNLLGADNITLD